MHKRSLLFIIIVSIAFTSCIPIPVSYEDLGLPKPNECNIWEEDKCDPVTGKRICDKDGNCTFTKGEQ